MKFINSETNSVTRDIVSVYCVNINVIAKQTGKRHYIRFYSKFIVASGNLSKIFTLLLIFLVANASVSVTVWSAVLCNKLLCSVSVSSLRSSALQLNLVCVLVKSRCISCRALFPVTGVSMHVDLGCVLA